MLNIAPDIYRQRLLIEGYFDIEVDAEKVEEFLLGIAAALRLRTYGKPIVFSPATGMGTDENAGYDAFVPLIDSGISAYIWSAQKFFSILLYTCKHFDAEAAKDYTRTFFHAPDDPVFMAF